jgi:cytochrome c553
MNAEHVASRRARIRRSLSGAAALLVLCGVVGFLVAASGAIPIKASAGHFAVTEWLLQFAKKRSVRTHSLGMERLSFEAPWLVAKGAGHYETGCRPCHGAPDLARPPRILRAALPPPPSLSRAALDWNPEELFYIVKHGIKLTGMPAWPSGVRDDEVHAVVAFVRELPRLDAAGYRRLVHGDGASEPDVEPLEDLAALDSPPRAVVSTCVRCHGSRGGGRRSAAYPSLAGQRRDYIAKSLVAYATDARQSGMMQPVAAALSEDEIAKLADYYFRQPHRGRRQPSPLADGAAHERGRAIAERGIPARDVPSCVDCHGPRSGPQSDAVPVLEGQLEEYLYLQLELFAKRARGGTDRAHVMEEFAPKLKPAEMRDLARYYSAVD